MSILDDFSFENFQRLDDFPTYTSIIRSFGRPIIPPLLTPQKRELCFQLRQLAVLKKKPFKNTKEAKSCESLKIANENSYMKLHNSNASSKLSNFNNSAFCSSNQNNYLPKNEMLVTTCKIPCSGICSTVHDSVIVCPNETMKDSNENTSTETEIVDSNSETFETDSENDCDCHTCQIHSKEVPYQNIHIDQTNVSEDDQDVVPGEAEFESLPTVIYNKKHHVSDTDTESIATYITQSTDLDKYMDYPIEFSSPDDVAIISQTQYSNFRNVSSRSEDASTETIINTENELSPCTSTLTGLNEFTEGSNNNHSSAGHFIVADESVNRTYSVDSYMLASKTCDKKLYFRKSESEPLQPHLNKNQNSFISSIESDTFNQNYENKAQSAHTFTNTILNTVEKCSIDLLSNPECCSDSEFIPVLEGNIRRNSYTLLQPSPALIEAHADCCCQNNSIDASPHSCSSQHQNSPVNVAFKKEMVELILPPMKDRDKMFPVLNYEELSENFYPSGKELELDVINSELDSEEEKSNSIYKSLPKSELNSNVSRMVKTNFQENSSCCEKDFSLTEASQNLRNCLEKSPVSENELGTNCNSEILKLFKELKDSHELQANQLMEEQNKQWLKLQEEFKNQERRLLEHLKSSGIDLYSGNDSMENATVSIADVETNAQTSVNNLYINKKVSHSDSSDSSSETLPTVIQNKIDRTVCSNDEPLCISPIESVTSESCNVILKNVTETAYNLCDARQENDELIQTNACHSNSDVSLQENIEQMAPYSSLTSSSQSVIDVQQSNSSVSFTRNDIKSFESYQNSGREGSFPHVSLISTVLPSKMTKKEINEISTEEDVKLKLFNLNKENNIFCHNSLHPIDQFQLSEISENVQRYPHCNANELNTVHDSNIDNLKANVNNDVKISSNTNINSDLSNINSNDNEKPDKNLMPALETADKPQTTSAASDNPVKALKVSSSLTVIKRRISRDVNDPEFLKKLKRVPAMVKGYLTRRLLKTEKIEGMLQTMQESVKLLQNLSEESKKGNPISEQDEELEQKLLNQLITTYEEFYDIFFTISLKERLDLIAQSRKYRLKKIRATKQKSNYTVNSNLQNASNSSSKSSLQKNASNMSLRNSAQLDSTSTSANSTRSSVSNSSLTNDRPPSLPAESAKHMSQHCTPPRKKKSITNSRTYTKEDFKECQARACSNSSLKSDNKTTRIYQSATNMSRQIKSLVKPVQTKPWK